MFEPLRKSEGNKRRKIGDDQIRDIVQLYADFEPTKKALILDAQDFGYRRIRVLRPLRHKIVVSDAGFEALAEHKAWEKRTDDQRQGWREVLAKHAGTDHDWHWIDSFAKATAKKDPSLGKADAALIKAFQKAFGVRDEDLDPVKDKKGNLIPDDDLTDYENVPMGTDIHDYLAAEVTPHAHDAYIDETYVDETDGDIGIVGYEINFNRYFYGYVPPRDLDEIDAELKAIEASIAEVLAEVTE